MMKGDGLASFYSPFSFFVFSFLLSFWGLSYGFLSSSQFILSFWTVLFTVIEGIITYNLSRNCQVFQ